MLPKSGKSLVSVTYRDIARLISLNREPGRNYKLQSDSQMDGAVILPTMPINRTFEYKLSFRDPANVFRVAMLDFTNGLPDLDRLRLELRLLDVVGVGVAQFVEVQFFLLHPQNFFFHPLEQSVEFVELLSRSPGGGFSQRFLPADDQALLRRGGRVDG